MMDILLVDDHEIVRRGLKQLLAEQYPGAKFGEAASCAEAVALIHGAAWDLAVLDINLPGRSGFELMEDLNRLQVPIPVLVLSAYPEEEFAIRSFQLGAGGYLNKNSVSDEMLAAVRKVLAGGKYVSPSLGERLAGALGQPQALAPHESLSQREMQVLRLVATGKTIKEIAAELSLSEKTIATYRSRISEKLGLSTNVELARYALKHGLVD